MYSVARSWHRSLMAHRPVFSRLIHLYAAIPSSARDGAEHFFAGAAAERLAWICIHPFFPFAQFLTADLREVRAFGNFRRAIPF